MSHFKVNIYKKLTINVLEADKNYQIRNIFRYKTRHGGANLIVFGEKTKEKRGRYPYIHLPQHFDSLEAFKCISQLLKKYPDNFYFVCRKLFNGALIFDFKIIKKDGEIIERVTDFYKLNIYHRQFHFKITLLSNIAA